MPRSPLFHQHGQGFGSHAEVRRQDEADPEHGDAEGAPDLEVSLLGLIDEPHASARPAPQPAIARRMFRRGVVGGQGVRI